jgi:flagellar protein FlgJ
MISSSDISGRFALDSQSIDKLRLQSRQDPGKALKTVAQQFESVFLNMMMKSMREASPQDGPLDSDQTRFYTEMFDRQLTQKLSSGKGIGLADMIVKQMSRLPGQDGQAEKIAADAPITPIPLKKPQPPVDLHQPPPALKKTPAETGKTQKYFVDPDGRPRGAIRADAETGETPKDFVERLWPHAASAGKDLGVSPHFLLGQAALESAWGKSEIRGADGKSSHNLFGIKAGKGWHGDVVETATTEYVNGAAQKTTAQFRAYPSDGEAFRDYANLLRGNSRYADVLENGRDAAGFAGALQRSGYATDPLYADKLTRILNSTVLHQALAG